MMRRWARRRSVRLLLVCAALAVVAAACGGSGSAAQSPATSTTGAPKPGSAKIVSFDVPSSLTCAQSATSTTAHVTYSTSGGKKQELLVDGRALPLDSASGAIDAPVHCDGLPHTFVLYVTDSNGRPTSLQKLLMTQTS
jgi:hypothetical protein